MISNNLRGILSSLIHPPEARFLYELINSKDIKKIHVALLFSREEYEAYLLTIDMALDECTRLITEGEENKEWNAQKNFE